MDLKAAVLALGDFSPVGDSREQLRPKRWRRSRDTGFDLRQIRAKGQDRECARRRARMKKAP